jgi:hypothetical protein
MPQLPGERVIPREREVVKAGGREVVSSLRACIAGKADGIVVDGVGGGNMNVPLYKAICDALEAGIPVVISSRHLGGQPHISKGYPGSLKSVIERGAIAGGHLSGIMARILLMVALAHTQDRKKLAEIFARARLGTTLVRRIRIQESHPLNTGLLIHRSTVRSHDTPPKLLSTSASPKLPFCFCGFRICSLVVGDS